MKKIISTILLLALVVVVVAGLIVANMILGTPQPSAHSETYVGYVSETAYADAESAADAFVRSELDGDASACTYVSYAKASDLTEAELTAYGVASLFSGTVTAAESGVVTYRDGDAERTASVCFLTTDDGVRYFALPLVAGDRLTDSYYSSVMSLDRYSNFTADIKGQKNASAALSEFGIAEETPYAQTLAADGAHATVVQYRPDFTVNAYFAGENSGKMYVRNPYRTDDEKYYAAGQLESSVESVTTLNIGARTETATSLDSRRDLLSLCTAVDADASYFVKTDYGFRLADDKQAAFASKLFNLAIEGTEAVYARADYYVTDGRLAAVDISASLRKGTYFLSVTVHANLRDFGATQVTVPAALSGETGSETPTPPGGEGTGGEGTGGEGGETPTPPSGEGGEGTGGESGSGTETEGGSNNG